MWVIEERTAVSEDVRGVECDYQAAIIIHVDSSGRFNGRTPPMTVPTAGGLAAAVCGLLNIWEEQGWKFGKKPPVV